MAGTGDIKAGKAYVELYLNKSLLVKGLKGVAGEMRAFGAGISAMGKQLMAAGLGVTAPMLMAAKSWASSGAELMRMSQRTGMAVEQLSALKFAAESSGIEMETLESGIKKMQKAIYASASGKGEGPAFLRDLIGMNPEQQLGAIADKMSGITNPTERAAVAMQIFGKGGTAMLPMLAGGSKGLAEFRKEAEAMGKIRSKEDAQAALAMSIAWTHLTGSVTGLKNALGSAIGPMLTGVFQGLQKNILAARNWVKENKPLIVQIFQIGMAAVGAGVGLFAVGKAIVFVAGAFSFAAKVVMTLGHGLGLITTVLGVVMNPVVLVTAGLVALAGYFLYTSGAAGKAVGYISSVFGSLASELKDTLGVIADSLAAGDLASAISVGWAFIKMEWTKGVGELENIWGLFAGYWSDSISGLAILFEDPITGIQIAWSRMLTAMQSMWEKWRSGLQSSPLYQEVMSSMISGADYDPFASPEEMAKAKDFKGKIKETMAGNASGSDNRVADIERRGKEEQDALEKKRKAVVDSQAAASGGHGSENVARQKAASDAEAAARKEWEAAKANARQKAAAVKPLDVKQFDPNGDMSMQVAHGSAASRGTFSATAVSGLAEGGNPIVKVNKEMKVLLGHIKELSAKQLARLTQLRLEAAP